jgi:hypothetical protein
MFIFKPWGSFRAVKDEAVLRRFLRGAADESEDAFKKGMQSKKHGKIYNRRGRRHQSSAPGEYPAIESGRLFASIDTRVDARSMEIGTSMFYSKWLRGGSRIMERRKMSDNALQEGVPRARHLLKGWATWKR